MDREFLTRVAAVRPETWDAVVPRFTGARPGRRGDEVALNPQPLPPLPAEVGARMLDRLADAAIIVIGGRGDVDAFLADIDDWCGTSWPRWWPRPPAPPGGWDDRQVFAGAALQAAVLAGQFDHNPQVRDVLLTAAERLAAAGG